MVGFHTFPSDFCIFKLLRYLLINFFDVSVETTSDRLIQSSCHHYDVGQITNVPGRDNFLISGF